MRGGKALQFKTGQKKKGESGELVWTRNKSRKPKYGGGWKRDSK